MMILSRSESPRLIILHVHSTLTTRSFITEAFLATTFFGFSSAVSAKPGDSIVSSTIKSLSDVAKTATASQGQTEHVEATRHEGVGLSPSSDHERFQNAEISHVHAVAISELRALQKELQTIVKQEVNIFFEIHDYISMNGQNVSSFILLTIV
jgi:hypothetical protein